MAVPICHYLLFNRIISLSFLIELILNLWRSLIIQNTFHNIFEHLLSSTYYGTAGILSNWMTLWRPTKFSKFCFHNFHEETESSPSWAKASTRHINQLMFDVIDDKREGVYHGALLSCTLCKLQTRSRRREFIHISGFIVL